MEAFGLGGIQDVPREVCGERVDILAALGERDWVKLKEDRWGARSWPAGGLRHARQPVRCLPRRS